MWFNYLLFRTERTIQDEKIFVLKAYFITFPACFLIPIIFPNLNSNCSNLLYLRTLQEQVKKAFCYQKLFWPFTVWINCSSDLKSLAFSLELQTFFTITRPFFTHRVCEPGASTADACGHHNPCQNVGICIPPSVLKMIVVFTCINSTGSQYVSFQIIFIILNTCHSK